MYQDARGRCTHLAHVAHDPGMRPFGSLLQIRITKHEQRALPPGFQRDVFQIHAGRFHDVAPRRRRACECDLVNVQVTRNCGATVRAQAVEDVDHPWWEACFFDQRRKIKNTERGLLSRFDYDCVPTRQRRA